jgi:hypothetical protein
MTPIARTTQSTTVRRLDASHRAAEGSITAYLRDISAVGRREPMVVPSRVRNAASRDPHDAGLTVALLADRG